MQNYLTCTQNHVFLGYISVFSALINFLLIFLFFVCLCCFSLRACFHVLRLLSQMLRLEFHVNQRGLKRLHWSTSSRLTAPPQPISRRGAVTSLQCASLAAMLSVLFTCTGENGLLSAGKHISVQDTVICVCLSLLYTCLAIR